MLHRTYIPFDTFVLRLKRAIDTILTNCKKENLPASKAWRYVYDYLEEVQVKSDYPNYTTKQMLNDFFDTYKEWIPSYVEFTVITTIYANPTTCERLNRIYNSEGKKGLQKAVRQIVTNSINSYFSEYYKEYFTIKVKNQICKKVFESLPSNVFAPTKEEPVHTK